MYRGRRQGEGPSGDGGWGEGWRRSGERRSSERRSGERRLWERTRRQAEALELPRPFDAERFIAALAERRGRPISVLPVVIPSSAPCGLLVTTDLADYILYTAGTTGFHRQHILLHEAAHLLCGHDRGTPATAAASRLLLPGLSPALVRRVLGRSVYSEPQEREAELLASLILHRAQSEDAAAPPGDGTEPDRAEALVGSPHAPHTTAWTSRRPG
ncbi:ParH-like protein [Streptomyces sp. NPDC048290]|uniref:ParH-like protein n=1 Tax=Streptomyces sp. NPDC048290 TaxID=3155811 RepID=UPI0034438512